MAQNYNFSQFYLNLKHTESQLANCIVIVDKLISIMIKFDRLTKIKIKFDLGLTKSNKYFLNKLLFFMNKLYSVQSLPIN